MFAASSPSVAAQNLIDAVSRFAIPLPCGRDRILFLQGDEPTGVYLLWSGRAALSMSSIYGKEVLRMNVGLLGIRLRGHCKLTGDGAETNATHQGPERH